MSPCRLPCRAKPDETPSFYGVRATIPDGAGDKWPLMLFMLSTTAPPAFTTGEHAGCCSHSCRRLHCLQCGPPACRCQCFSVQAAAQTLPTGRQLPTASLQFNLVAFAFNCCRWDRAQQLVG